MIGCVTQEGIDASNAAALKAAGPPPGHTVHADLQGPLSPARLAVMRQTGQGAPPGSAYREGAAATAGVQVIDASGAADYERTLARLGPRRPSGDPAVIAGQPGHTAPTGAGARFGVSPPRDMGGFPSAVSLSTVGRRP